MAAAWAWRLLAVAAALSVIGLVVVRLSLVATALASALLLAAALRPLVTVLRRVGVPRLVTAWLVLLALLGLLALAGWLIGQAVVQELDNLQESVSEGLQRVRMWLVDGPIPVGERQIDSFTQQLIELVGGAGEDSEAGAGILDAANTASHVVTGILLTLFILFFFLADGRKIWEWVLRLTPRRSREAVDDAGIAAWGTLTGYVRGITLVALADAVLISIVLLVVGAPLVLPLAALTFLGAFIPVIGATIAGGAAVLVVLVNEGVAAAVIVLVAVLAIQWIDSDVLQPIVVGRAVEIHPLAIGLAVTVGGLLAGIPGAVVGVPAVAAVNAAVVALRQRAVAGQDEPSAPAPAGRVE